MSTPFLDMEAALWAYLGSKADYVALELNEFRAHEGRPAPFDFSSNQWVASSLPALCSEHVVRMKSERVANGWQDEIEVPMVLVYSTTGLSGAPASRSSFEAAVEVVRSNLMSQDAQSSVRGATVADFEITDQSFVAVPAHEVPGTVIAWEYRFRVRLVRPRVHI